MEQLDEARSQLDRCLEDHPTQPTVLDAALQLLDQLGESERATELLQQAAESKPESLTLQLNLARRFASFGQPDEAEEAMRSAAERIDEPDAWVALADLRVEWGNTRGAIQALDRAIEAETGASPGTPDFSYDEIDDRRLFAHGDLLLALAEIDRAREILAAIEEPVYRLLLEARIHHTAGDAERALDLYEESFLLWHSNPGARYLAAEAALEIDRVDDAIRHLRESVRADAAASEAGLLLARIHAAQGEPAAAAAALHLHVTAHPRDGEAVRMLAGLFDDADLGEEAEAIRERWRAIPGEAAAVEADQARRLAKSDGPEAALALLENEYGAALIERANAPALLAWTEIACEAGRGEEAEQRVRSAISRDPSSADLQAALGRCLLSRDRSDEAAMTLEKALTLDPDHLAAMRDRCLLRIFRRETGGAADACDGLTELGLQSIDARLAVSDEMAHAGLEALAIEQLESLIEDHPWLGPAALRIARLQLASGRVGEETLAHAERALRYPHGERPQALQTVGRVQHALGHPSNAVAPLLQSTRLAREDPLGWYYLGEVLLDLERRPEALDAYRAALSAGPFPLEETARRRIEELRPDAA
jgi:predicted Zn-dependent protease